VTPDRDPEDDMTDEEAADALFDAVMEGRGRPTVTLEELRKEYRRTTLELSVPFDVPVREADARKFLQGIRDYVDLNHALIHALEQRVTEVERERVHAIELLSRDYASRAAIESPWRMQLYLYEKQKKQLQQAEAERDEARRERDKALERDGRTSSACRGRAPARPERSSSSHENEL